MKQSGTQVHDRSETDRRSSREIQHDIDRTLADMDQTVDQLQDRLSVRGIIQDLTGAREGASRATTSRVWDVARSNPGPAALLGLGLAWLVADRMGKKGRDEQYEVGRGKDTDWLSPGAEYFPPGFGDQEAQSGSRQPGRRPRERFKEATGAMDKVKEEAASLKDHIQDRASDVKERASHLRDRLSSFKDHAGDRMHDLGERVRTQSSELRNTAEDLYDDSPLAFGAAAVAIGVGLGLLAPSTRKGDTSRQPHSKDRMSGVPVEQQPIETGEKTARESGSGEPARQERPLVEKAREVVSRVIDTAKNQGKGGSEGASPEYRPGESSRAGEQRDAERARRTTGEQAAKNIGDDVNVD